MSTPIAGILPAYVRSLTRLVVLACILLLASCAKAPAASFDGQRAFLHVQAQCDLGPRPVGSEANTRTAQYIESELVKYGWTVRWQRFEYRGVAVHNLLAEKGGGPVVILGAHYDTRTRADNDRVDKQRPVPGANDGASGVAVLLELARVLDVTKTGRTVQLAFFDAEDQGGIDGWPFSVGAQYVADHLDAKPEAVVVLDMIGDAQQQLYWEGNSDPALGRRLWGIAASLGYSQQFVPTVRHTLIDDHVPFREKGWAAIDIIDFDYPYWHTSEDTPDKVSAASLERVGRVVETWLEVAP